MASEDDDSESDQVYRRRVQFGDSFASPCRAIHRDIERSPMEEGDRSDLLNGLGAFYDAASSILSDINGQAKYDTGTVLANIRQLRIGWDAYKVDLLQALKSPYRTNYIDYCHKEILKLTISILNLLYHPPVTPQYVDLVPKLSQELATSFSEVMRVFKDLFVELLHNEKLPLELIEGARTPLRVLRSELPKKYRVFFLVEGKDKPTDAMKKMVEYIDRVLKTTQHLATRPDGVASVPDAVRKIDSALTSVEKFVLANSESETFEDESQILENLKTMFDATSTTGKSIARFSALSDSMSGVTGITSFLDGASNLSCFRDKQRLQAPWFKEPMFSAMDEARGRLIEYAAMEAARYADTLPIEQKLSRAVDAYGERDVLVQQIARLKERRAVTVKRHSDLVAKLERLNNLVKSGKSRKPTLENARALIQSQREELTLEKRQLEEADSEQKRTGSASLDVELQILQKVYEDHENLLKKLAEDKLEIKRLKLVIEKQQEEIDEKQRLYDDLAQKVDEISKRVDRQKERINKRYGKIEWLKGEMDRLKWENDNMAASEERQRQRIIGKISAVNDELDRLVTTEQKEIYALEDLKRQHEMIVTEVIPDLQYQIEKRSEELRYQTAQAIKQQPEASHLMMEAMIAHLRKQLGQSQ